MIFWIIVAAIVVGSIWYNKTKAGPKRTYNVDLTGQVIIITGCNAGIGKETARKLASHNATIIFACRSKERTIPVMTEIQQQTKNANLHYINIELSDYESVKSFVREFKSQFKRLDILINNAGIGTGKLNYNKRNQELTFATNHLGGFLLTNLLLDVMTDKSRIINLSSAAHCGVQNQAEFTTAVSGSHGSFLKAYQLSKLANVLHILKLQQIFDKQGRNIKCVALHPGVVRTEIFGTKNWNKAFAFLWYIILNGFQFMTLSEVQGAQTTIYCALQPYEELVPGGYYEKNNKSTASKLGRNFELAEELWKLSEEALRE